MKNRPHNSNIRRKLRFAATIAAVLATAACSADTTFWSPAASPKANQVELVHLTYDVGFAASQAEPDVQGRSGLDSFLARNDIGYGDRVYVIAADHDPDPLAIRRAEGIGRILAQQGLSPSVLPRAEWAGRPAETGAVRVLVHRFVVRAPKCPDFRKPGSGDFGNTESSNLGCANAVNLGLMVADPRDLIEGREDGVADGEREAAAIRRYREGKEFPLEKSGTGALK